MYKIGEWFDATFDCDKTYARYLGERKFEFISNMWLDTCEGDEGWPDRPYCIRHNLFNINKYDDLDLENAASFYYKNLEELREHCENQEEVDYNLAEAMFRNYPWDDSIGGMYTLEKSIEYIENFIKEN